MDEITDELLQSIEVLFCDPCNGMLWGIPYKMNTAIGQTPRHLWDSRIIPHPTKRPPVHIGATMASPGPRDGWIFLGTTEWSSQSPQEQELVEDFLAPIIKYNWLPTEAGSWVTREDWESD